MEAVTGFLILGSKVTVDGDCNHEIRRHLLLGRKGKTNFDRVLKSRDVTLPTKVRIVKAMVFPVVSMVMRAGPQRRRSAKQSMPLNCGAGEDL